MSIDEFAYPDGALSAPWLPWVGTALTVADGAATVGPFAFADGSRPESIGPDSYSEIIFRVPLDAAPGGEAGLGVRLTSHTGGSNGYMLQADGGNLQLFKDFTDPLGFGATTSNVEGLRLVARGATIEAYSLRGGVWTLQDSQIDTDYPDGGFTGFWLLDGAGSPPVVESFSWGVPTPLFSAASRFLARLEPVAYDDANQGGVLEAITTALMAPREVFSNLIREDDTHLPWGSLLDPDACPAELLPWLAVLAGVALPPSATTDDEKRYRIKQAAGRYRCTPRAVVEELQLVLTGTKTVYVGFFTPDEWHYTVGTLATETPDADAVDRSVQAQKPVGMLAAALTTGDWVWLFLAPTLIGARAEVEGVDSYVLTEPPYPTWQDVIDHFTTWQDVIDNTPH